MLPGAGQFLCGHLSGRGCWTIAGVSRLLPGCKWASDPVGSAFDRLGDRGCDPAEAILIQQITDELARDGQLNAAENHMKSSHRVEDFVSGVMERSDFSTAVPLWLALGRDDSACLCFFGSV